MNAPRDLLIQRDRFALVLVDMQERLAAVMDRREDVVANATRLIGMAGLVEAPIIVTRQYPKGLGDTVSELDAALAALPAKGAAVLRVDKTAFCCCAEPDFQAAMKAVGREQFVLAGMETHICVAQTALSLYGDGYSVHVAADACCSRSADNHDLALARMRAAGVIVSGTESVAYEAVGRAGTDEFRQLLDMAKQES